VLDGQLVVDLWGGWADRLSEKPWKRDSLQLVFSGTKGFVAVCILMLIERGQLELDGPVSRYWPEFGGRGKSGIRVQEVVSHRARLPAVRARLTEADLVDPERIAALLADQVPESDRSGALMYHALTFGWLCQELVRRVDGRTIGRFFAEEVATPLRPELWIGLPAEEEHLVTKLRYGSKWGLSPGASPQRKAQDALLALIYDNPPILPIDDVPWNTRAFHAAEIPGGGAIGTARAIARLCECLARGGGIDDVRILAPQTIEVGRTQLAYGADPFAGGPIAFGVGFQLQTDSRHLGPPPDAFGHDGAGGSVHAAWPHIGPACRMP
jgi:CubicO group peptidase (beta-lactamase class C family)